MATPLNSDFKDIVRALSSARVRYLVVGGFAVIEHTEPRYTKDLDLWSSPLEPVRIDILMGLEAVTFAAAWKSRKTVRWGALRVPVMSAAHLIANKKRVGRPQDLADVARLQQATRARRR